MEHTLASYFAARDARTKAAMALFNRIPRCSRGDTRLPRSVFEAALGLLMFAPFVMMGNQVVGMALFVLGCFFFLVALRGLNKAARSSSDKISVCLMCIDAPDAHPEFIAAMEAHKKQRIEEEWEPLF